jgi:hypothetical protein
MRILVLDIETAPNLAHVWGLWNQNVGLSQLLESGRVICFAAKWVGSKKMMFFSEHEHGHEVMVTAAHHLLDEADVVVHYNGKKFDIPWLNTEFMRYGLEPPAPFKEVDLLRVVRQGRFPSNKLDAIAKELGLVGKVKHDGHVLWIKCLLGDPAAWKQMKKYNIQDVRLTEEVYHRLLPWIKNHPSHSLYEGREGCSCGSANLERRGYAYTAVSRFQQFRCRDCGRWSRSGKAESRVDLRPST